MEITKKIWPRFFKDVKSGKKCFEFRLADFLCKEGDILVLREWNPRTKKYTGRKITKKVGYIAKFKGTEFWSKKDIEKHGFYIIGLK